MAFWGIEVTEGKPYIHRYDSERGRLHISQAALGTFSSKEKTKRVLVQCNVGEAMRVFLCSLYPEKNETCQLNHDFEEYDEVTFSVLGPHSVHLSGYFYSDYGENQENFEDDYGSEDMTESEGEEDYSDYDTENSEDLEDTEDDFIGHDIGMFPPSPVPNSGVRIEEIIDDEKPATDENGTSQRPKKKTNKLSGFDDSQRQIVIKGGTVVPDIESENEDEDGFPIKKKSNVSNTEEKTEVKDNIIGEGLKKKEKEDTDVSIKSVKRKIRAVVGDVDQSRETGKSFDSSVTTDDHETFDKQARKNKKKKVNKEEATNMNMDQAVAAEKENEEKLTGENFREKKKKKNKKKNKKQDSAADSHENESNMEIEKKAETKAAKPVQERTFPNGLVIEELGMGKPNGKKASPGKKVSVQYIGKLKKSGKIFDSNVGRPPFKFRLGVGEVIKGWDVGVSGMRVGDKRRLTIPPAMGYGVKGAPGAIPPNAWLVFDVELVDVN